MYLAVIHNNDPQFAGDVELMPPYPTRGEAIKRAECELKISRACGISKVTATIVSFP